MNIFIITYIIIFSTVHISCAIDLSGIEIGSKIDDQKNKIVDLNSNFKILEYNIIKQKCIDGVALKDKQEVDCFFTCSDDNGLISFVARKQLLQDGERIKPELFLDSLQKKFGKFTKFPDKYFFYDYNKGYILQLDLQGDIFQGKAEDGPCWEVGFSGHEFKTNGMYSHDSAMRFPNKINETCNLFIVALTTEEKYSGLINMFTISIFDNKRIVDEYLLKMKEKKYEQNKLIEQEMKKDNKPKL